MAITGPFPIRPLRALADLRPAVELQKTYWGDDIESVVPAQVMFSIANHGGHVLGAFDGDRLIGLLIGFLGTNPEDTGRPAMANLQLVSKRMIVLDEYRGHGIGYRLKLRQRELAIAAGVRLVTWTFDPLLAANAHLNIRKLGAICPEYLVDYYGTEEAGRLATLGSSDRLAVEWWVTNRRVEERLHGSRSDLSLSHYLQANTPIINPTSMTSDGAVVPSAAPVEAAGSLALLEIPVNYMQLVRDNPALAMTWRGHTRDLFLGLFQRGFIATDFLRESLDGRERAFYLLSYNGPQFESVRMN